MRFYTHIKGHTHTLDFLTAFRSAASKLVGPVFLCGILVHLALEKLFVHFQEENWENFCLPCMALHLTKAECVCACVRFSSSQCTLLSNFDCSFLSLFLGLPISFFSNETNESVAQRDRENCVLIALRFAFRLFRSQSLINATKSIFKSITCLAFLPLQPPLDCWLLIAFETCLASLESFLLRIRPVWPPERKLLTLCSILIMHCH